MTAFKIYFNDLDIRRISTEGSPSFAQLHELLLKNYKNEYHPELVIQYTDDEGDKITVTSDEELSYMYLLMKDTSPIKIYISDAPGFSAGQYFKDGPAPEPVRFYSGKAGEHRAEPSLDFSELASNVSKCLESLFPGGKILPYHIPDWLQEQLSVRALGRTKHEVDLDVNIPGLYKLLHSRALALMEAGDLGGAQDTLLALLNLSPRDVLAHYNLACAYALEGGAKVDRALQHLQRAVELGYSNLTHLKADTDLDNLRELPGFIELVARMEEDVDEEEVTPAAPIDAAVAELEKAERAMEERIIARMEEERAEAEAAAEMKRAEEAATKEAEEAAIKEAEEAAKRAEAEAKKQLMEEEAKKRAERAEKAAEAKRMLAKLKEEARKAKEESEARLARAKQLEEEAKRAEEEVKKADEEAEKAETDSRLEELLRKRYPTQLDAIRSRGFEGIDLDVLGTLLKKYKGDVALVIEHLL